MASIYCLETEGFIWYVGSTLNERDRERRHRSRSAKGYGASLIPLDYEWEFKVIERCGNDEKKVRERHWIETLRPILNKYIPSRTQEELQRHWRRNNLPKLAAKTRQHRQENLEEMMKYEASYREANRHRLREYQREYQRARRAKKKSMLISNTPIE